MAKKVDYSAVELKETLIDTKRVSKTVKGGRIARFSALVVVGDGAGHVGYGLGKAAEVPEAIRKAIEAAKRNVIEVSVKGTTIPHEIIGEFGAGIRDIRGKSLRSNNAINVVKATFEALRSLRTAEQVAKVRGISVEAVNG